jgi:hypothetical protein
LLFNNLNLTKNGAMATHLGGPRAPVAYGSLRTTPAKVFLHHSVGRTRDLPDWQTAKALKSAILAAIFSSKSSV